MGREALDLAKHFAGLSVFCLGDVMLDRYLYGSAERISPEAPVPVVQIRRQMLIPGGVGNVARNLAAFGLRPTVVGVVGEDTNAVLLEEQFARDGAECLLPRDPERPTSVKTRVIAGIQQVVRYDVEKTTPVSEVLASRLLDALRTGLGQAAVLTLSDYRKGVMTPELTRTAIQLALAQGKPVLVDPKGHDYAKYAGADLVKPNRKELGEAVGHALTSDEEVADAGRELMRRHDIKNVLVTLSERGMLLLKGGDGGGRPVVLPSRAREVYDVTGAGDTVLAGLAAGLAAGAPLELAARFANLAAGVVVGKVGTAVATVREIEQALLDEG